MKKTAPIILFLVGIMVLYVFSKPFRNVVYNFAYISRCDKPITYKLGTIDPKFGITGTAFLQDVDRAGQIWSVEENKKLFAYDPNGDITVNLIYDQRQYLNSQINSLNSDVKKKQDQLTPEIADYKKRASAFKLEVDKLNQDINYWNSRGGAPPDVYNQLKTRQETLQQTARSLEQEAISLNQSTDEYNAQVGQLNQTVTTFNNELSYKPEEGEYVYNNGKQTINIYFDNSQSELVHTLAHELGHSLGIPHNNNQLSIMYPKTTTALSPSTDDKAGLEEACRKRSLFEIYVERIRVLIKIIRSNFAK